MKKYNVTLEGSFLTEVIVDAESYADAEAKAKEKFDTMVSLDREDYAFSLTAASEVNNG